MLQIGQLLDGKYKILSEIGHGGMSVVYMALNEKANKTWAVKEVRKDGKMDFNIVRQGLMAEIDTLKKLEHPNLPSIIDVIENEDSFIIVMDYIEGRSLDKVLEEHGAQPLEYVVEWVKQLCGVLGYLHTRQPPIIYRDMKPANIMLKPDGNVMVIDFGTAKNYEIDLGRTTGIGTVGFAAPEQYKNSGMGRTDARTDIYCLGMTMFNLLTNIDPCRTVITEKYIRSQGFPFPRGIIDILVKCIQPLPEDRYQSCEELLYDLNHYTELEPLYRKRQVRKIALFAATAAASLLLGAAGLGLHYAASREAVHTYQDKLYEASRTSRYEEQVRLYTECMDIPSMAGEPEAYLGLIQACRDNDATFTADEANLLTKYIKRNKEALQKNPAHYAEICFEVGKLYWYHYSYGDGETNQATNAKSSIEWFQDAIRYAPEESGQVGMATAYADIGMFYRDIDMNVLEGSEEGQYAPFFARMSELLHSVAADRGESDIVRLELLELARSALQKYPTKFKADGLREEDLLEMYDTVARLLGEIEPTADITTEKKANTVSMLEETYEAVKTAYGTKTGGRS